MIQFEAIETAGDPHQHARKIEERLNDGWSILSHSIVTGQFTGPESGELTYTIWHITLMQRGIRADALHLPSVVETLSIRVEMLRAQVGALQAQIALLQPAAASELQVG